MKWNTKQKASAAVLALAGAALCVDRFVLGYGPQSAAAAVGAAPPESAAPAAPPESVAAHTPHIASPPAPTLTQRIAALGPVARESEAPSVRDALRSPRAWTALARESEQPAAHPAAEATTAKQAPQFTVTSVFQGSGKTASVARINGTVVRAGETIRGHTFLRIEPGSPSVVVLQAEDEEIRVPLTIGSNGNASQGEAAADAPR